MENLVLEFGFLKKNLYIRIVNNRKMKNETSRVTIEVVLVFAVIFLFGIVIMQSVALNFEHKHKENYIELSQKIDSVYSVLNDIRNADTLLFNTTNNNARTIDTLKQNTFDLSERFGFLQYEINEINYDLNAYD